MRAPGLHLVLRTGSVAGCLLTVVLCFCCVSVGSASAASSSSAPSWRVTPIAFPTVLPPGIGKKGRYYVAVENVGAAGSKGKIEVHDRLPAGLTVEQINAEPELSPTGESSTCSQAPVGASVEVTCTYPSSFTVVPAGFLTVKIDYVVTGSVGALDDSMSVEGGGAPSASGEVSTRLGSTPHETAPAGISRFGFQETGPAGEPVTQAGGHPHFLTTTLLLNNVFGENLAEPLKPVQAPDDLAFYLPLGLLGDPGVTQPCPASDIVVNELPGCPPSSRVGTILAMVTDTVSADTFDPTNEFPIYSVQPEKGYAAEFAFVDVGLTIPLYANVVRHDGQYVLRVASPGVPGIAYMTGLIATFYGDIQEPYSVPIEGGSEELKYDRGAFLTNPSDCEEGPGAREASVAMNTWDEPQAAITASTPGFAAALEGCGLLSFSSTLTGGPDVRVGGDSTRAEEPSGYGLDLRVPQAQNTGSGLATPPYEGVDFTFPEGTSLSPGAANGLSACAASGPHGIDIPPVGAELAGSGKIGEEFSEGEVVGADGLPHPAPGHCPSSSIVGTARASTPLLSEELEGHLYLAEPECGNSAHPNGCTPEDAASGSIYRLYLELEAPERGVIIKLPGKAEVNPSTGQITSVFEGTPQFPVSDLRIETSGGPRAPLANPVSCGVATVTGRITPWSGGLVSEPSSGFEVNEGCGAHGFGPSFVAGTSNPLAGAYTPFSLVLEREDGEQDISSLKTTLPEGLLAAVSHVEQCPEPQASVGGCPAGSLVGSASVGIGSGSDPYYETGQVYFTGPYGGGPFGLSIVVPAVAGPFDLGNVIVRAGLKIDPSTARVTAETPVSGQPGGIPQMLDGVPLRIRTMNISLNDPSFTFNATRCVPSSVTATIVSTQGAQDNTSSPYDVTGCPGLSFKPVLTASTQAKASKADGASLTVKVTSGAGQANIAKVDLQLPKQLPARLTTLQKACTEGQFAANPAGCPGGSVIGTATAVTPILRSPLSGPAYLVSHGGAAFPDVEFVLQGENGVEIVLDGGTQIKKGVTYSRFESVPDAPISSFTTVLPEGPHSALSTDLPAKARYDLCGAGLSMPTTIVAQNGAVITQSTKVAVTGCPKALTRKQKLHRALAACRKHDRGAKRRRQRVACERAARKRYGARKKKTGHGSKRGKR